MAIWKKSIPAFHFSPWAETNEEIEYKRELETEEEREKKQNKFIGCYRSGPELPEGRRCYSLLESLCMR